MAIFYCPNKTGHVWTSGPWGVKIRVQTTLDHRTSGLRSEMCPDSAQKTLRTPGANVRLDVRTRGLRDMIPDMSGQRQRGERP